MMTVKKFTPAFDLPKKVVTPEEITTQEEFNAVMNDPTTELSIDSGKIDLKSIMQGKPKQFYDAVKQTLNKEKVESNMNTVTEQVSNTMTSTYGKAKESRLYKWIKKVASSTVRFLGKNKTAVAVGTFSTVLGGILTSTVCAAVAVGTAVAVATVIASHLMTRKKDHSLSYKAMLSDIGIAAGTSLITPIVLFLLVYSGVYAVSYGFILPYQFIVA
jgi:hypothetical protein